MKMYLCDASFQFRRVNIKGVRKPREWPARPGCWHRKTSEGPMLFVSLTGAGTWHMPRLPTMTRVVRVYSEGNAQVSRWLNCLADGDFAQAIWRATT